MKKYFKNLIIVLGIIAFTGLNQSCTHDPFLLDEMEPDPMDTMTNPMDTMVVDTTIMENPCDSTVIYFKKDILPILQGSCALSGCHDASSAAKGVILDNYENVTNTIDVSPFNLGGSQLYEILTTSNTSQIMPPGGKLENTQISLIAQWILQGALDLECDYEPVGCDTVDISYSGTISKILSNSCYACHSTSIAFGDVILDTYDGVKKEAESDRLLGVLNWDQGFQRMPQGKNQLDSCTIAKVKSWIDEGAQNN